MLYIKNIYRIESQNTGGHSDQRATTGETRNVPIALSGSTLTRGNASAFEKTGSTTSVTTGLCSKTKSPLNQQKTDSFRTIYRPVNIDTDYNAYHGDAHRIENNIDYNKPLIYHDGNCFLFIFKQF